MDFQGLQRALARTGTQVTIGSDTLPGSFADFLGKYYLKQGKQIQIDSAEVTLDEKNSVVQITGRADFFSVARLPVTAAFSLDEQGNGRAIVTYTLRDRSGSMSAWKFSTSFPGIPPLLDTLTLLEATVVVATHRHTDAATHAELDAGISFLGQMSPTGLVGVLDGAVGGKPTLPLYGTIRIPVDETDLLAPSLVKDLTATRTYPWEVEPALPGIHLQAPLGVELSLGKLKINGASYRLFSPLSDEWPPLDDVFDPITAVTGSLDVPSAGIAVDVIATAQTIAQGTTRRADLAAFVEARCKGLSIGNLAHLADITGSADLSSGLPDSLTGPLKALQKLALQDLAFSLSAGAQGLYLTWASLTIGAPGCRWRIWGDHVDLTDIGLRFNVVNPLGIGGRASFQADVFGTAEIEGVPVEIKASKDSGGFLLAGRLKEKETLPLKRLMKAYLPAIPAPADLTIDDLRVSIDATGLQLAGAAAQKPETWKLALGPGNLTVSDVIFDFIVPGSGSVMGMFRGNIGFGKDIMLSMAYTIPGSFALRATTEKLSLSHLRSTLSNQKLLLPAGFDITLPSSTILIEEQSGSLRFQLATKVDGVGYFAFEAQSVGGGAWGFAAGMDLGSAKPSALPGLGAISAFEKMVQLEKLALIVASYDNAKFQFPDLAKFQNPLIGTGKVALPPQSGGLRAGLNIFAEWRIDESDKTQNLLTKLLGLNGTLGITLQVGTDTLRLFVRRDAKIAGYPMSCEFGLMTSFGPSGAPAPSWFLTGSLKLSIQGQPQTFDVTAAFVAGGAFMSATMKGATAVNCGPFKLSNLALQIGVNWAGIPSLGVAATIDVKNFSSSVAVFFDSTDPSRSLVAGSISSITAKDVMNAFVGGLQTPLDEVLKTIAIRGTHEFSIPGDLTDELDDLVFDKVAAAFATAKVTIPSSSQQLSIVPKTRGASWHLTDLLTMRHYELDKKGNKIQVRVAPQFYFAPQPTFIGTIRFPQAFYLNAAISFAGFDATATVDISPNKGFSIEAQTDKLVILDEKLFSIAALQGGGGPKISVSTFTQPDNPVVQFRLPHFYVNGSLTMLGVKQGIYATVSVHGIDFELVGQLVPGVNFDLDARFGKSGLGAGGRVKVGVGTIDLGALGKAKINTDLEVEVDIEIDNGANGNGGDAYIELESSFSFAGQHVNIGKFRLDVKSDTFVQLPSIVAKKVEEALRDVFKDATKWANAVNNGVMDGVSDTSKVFKDVYGKSEKEAKDLAKNMSKGVNQATNAVENVAKDAGKSAKKTIKKVKFW
jgi:hypothetical protein